MKTTLKIFTLTAILFGFATISYAQSTDNATADVGARILTALTISAEKDLNFGVIASTSALQTATIAAEQGGTRSGNAAYVGETYTVGEFLITGEKNQEVGFTVDSTAKLTSTTDDDDTMDIEFTRSYTGNSFDLDDDGNATMYVGGTLTVAAGQNSGTYKGTYKVTVNYN